MKKRSIALLCVLLAMCVIGTSAVRAQEAVKAEQEIQEIGIEEAAAGKEPDSGSYTIVDGDETLLEVSYVDESMQNRSSGGYYTAEFIIPATNSEVYLTGLTQDNVDEIRQEIVDSYQEGSDIELRNLGFIDTEKTWDIDGDENLCWAASASNILTYTGWADLAGFDSTDDLFEHFIECFNDDSGNPYYAYAWFFNGIKGKSGAQPVGGTGRFLPEYYYEDITELFYFFSGNNDGVDRTAAENFSCLYDALHEGKGVTLSVDIYNNGDKEGSHNISCWGFVSDIRYPEDHPLRYKSIIVTDSDSDKLSVRDGADRRDADDVMSLFTLESFVEGSFDTCIFNISPGKLALIKEACSLCPYSEAIPHETDDNVSCDVRTTPDITIYPFYLTDDQNVDQLKTKFLAGSYVYYKPHFCNNTNFDYNGDFSISFVVVDSNGKQVYSKPRKQGDYTIYANQYSCWDTYFNVPPRYLPVGDYTMIVTFNPNKKGTEAYYYNNTKRIDFKVRESYMRGDTDNDGDITILDTTYIQRMLACYPDAWDGNVTQRIDVNRSGDADVMDATIIQRYLAKDEELLYPVNVYELYD